MPENSSLEKVEKIKSLKKQNGESSKNLEREISKKQSKIDKSKESENATFSSTSKSSSVGRKGQEEIEQVHESIKTVSSALPISSTGTSLSVQRVRKKNIEKTELLRTDGTNPEEASTSRATQRSILRENNEPAEDNYFLSRFFRIHKLWSKNLEREKKSILFVDQRESRDSLESIVTIIGTSRPLKSALRSGDSIRSGNSSSVRFSLPPTEATRMTINDDKSLAVFKLANWNIVCEIVDDPDDRRLHAFRSIYRTRFCKIFMCLTLGILVPSFLIVPVLVYVDDSTK